MYGFSPWLTVAQVLVEYAEQGNSVLVVDDGSEKMGQVLYHIAHMLGFRDPEELTRGRLPVSLSVCDDPARDWDAVHGVPVGGFERVGGFSVMYHPGNDEHDEHMCDMGDATETLLVMLYPNDGFRLLRMRTNDLELGPNGRLVEKS
jgi:hypothetical protein